MSMCAMNVRGKGRKGVGERTFIVWFPGRGKWGKGVGAGVD